MQGNSAISNSPNSSNTPSENPRLRTDTLAASVVILLLVTIVQRSVGFGRGILFCRWLSPETLGQWEMAYSFMLLAAPLAVLGVPGSFGRYVEHYRQQGQLKTFLRRTTIWTAVCSSTAIGIILWFAPQFSQLIFGSGDCTGLITGICLCLIAIIFHHMLTSLFTALRMYRVVSAMTFSQSLLFAAVSLGLLWWNPHVSSMLIGYGSASLFSSLGALVWTLPGFRQVDSSTKKISHSDFWMKLLRFAFFVWVSNLLSHLFGIVDRYMIVHFGGLSPAEAMQQVGYYHSSRLLPLLLVSFADLLSGLVMPHLSHDWEAGRRAEVSRRLDYTLKLTILGMLAIGVGILLFAPVLFHVILQGKYSDGLIVLPWTLTGCICFGVYSVAQNYIWCAERLKIATLPLAVGLIINVLLNFMLLPIWGLFGAVLATAISTIVCLLVTLLLNQHAGMHISNGTWLLGFAPVSLGFGVITSATVLSLLVLCSFTTNLIFSKKERQIIHRLWVEKVSMLFPAFSRRRSVSGSA